AMVLSAAAYGKLQSAANGRKKDTFKGIAVSILAGLLMGVFFRFIMASIGTSDYSNLIPGRLSPYSAIAVFSLAVFVSNFLWNSLNMYFPLTGSGCRYSDYFSKGSFFVHLIGMLGGVIWAVGTSFSIIASGAAGPSISYGLGQGATMVAAIWGVFIWREFKDAPKGTNKLLTLMFVGYISGLLMIIASRLY
ncbi:MAG: multidrug DMT transporter permease, partial [Oligoflexales bacterium]|nr:multidrug DMT transporter permease [Oligoflexales bacterium]